MRIGWVVGALATLGAEQAIASTWMSYMATPIPVRDMGETEAVISQITNDRQVVGSTGYDEAFVAIHWKPGSPVRFPTPTRGEIGYVTSTDEYAYSRAIATNGLGEVWGVLYAYHSSKTLPAGYYSYLYNIYDETFEIIGNAFDPNVRPEWYGDTSVTGTGRAYDFRVSSGASYCDIRAGNDAGLFAGFNAQGACAWTAADGFWNINERFGSLDRKFNRATAVNDLGDIVVTACTDDQGFCNASTAFILSKTAIAVPEPESWAMMIVGFGIVGGAMRLRTGRNGSRRRWSTVSAGVVQP